MGGLPAYTDLKSHTFLEVVYAAIFSSTSSWDSSSSNSSMVSVSSLRTTVGMHPSLILSSLALLSLGLVLEGFMFLTSVLYERLWSPSDLIREEDYWGAHFSEMLRLRFIAVKRLGLSKDSRSLGPIKKDCFFWLRITGSTAKLFWLYMIWLTRNRSLS